jgi:peptidoglycan/LPS O-acetylase OafA/YrhL
VATPTASIDALPLDSRGRAAAQVAAEPGARTPLGFEAPAGNPRFPLIDSLRGVAAASVFLYHFASADPHLRGPVGKLFGHGNFGVVLFFLISGFLLYRPFVTSRQTGGLAIDVSGFYRRRALRVIPAYWVALTILAIYPGIPIFHTRWWQLYLFGQVYDPHTTFAGIGPAWSLCTEVSFYILLPLYAYAAVALLARVTAKAALWIELALLAVLALASMGLHQVLHASPTDGNLGFTLPATFYLFAAGMALALISVHYQGTRLPALIAKLAPACWGAAILLYVGVALTINSSSLGSVHPVYALIALLILLPATVPSSRRDPITRLLASKRIAWLGLVSYAFYLWHQAVITTLAKHVHSEAVLFVAALAITLAIAAASYHLVEAPWLRMKTRLARGHTRSS